MELYFTFRLWVEVIALIFGLVIFVISIVKCWKFHKEAKRFKSKIKR